jgi:hypothetical protein
LNSKSYRRNKERYNGLRQQAPLNENRTTDWENSP